jgi:hypothetical protein
VRAPTQGGQAKLSDEWTMVAILLFVRRNLEP